MIKTRDQDHVDEIVKALDNHGFTAKAYHLDERGERTPFTSNRAFQRKGIPPT